MAPAARMATPARTRRDDVPTDLIPRFGPNPYDTGTHQVPPRRGEPPRPGAHRPATPAQPPLPAAGHPAPGYPEDEYDDQAEFDDEDFGPSGSGPGAFGPGTAGGGNLGRDGFVDGDGYDGDGFHRDGFHRDGFDRNDYEGDEYDEDEYEYDGIAGEPDADGAQSPAREWLAMVMQLAVGAVGGAGLWLAFQWLWRFIPLAAFIAALLVIIMLVWVVRRIRRADDLQTTVVTVLVGLFVTVSPAALLLLDR